MVGFHLEIQKLEKFEYLRTLCGRLWKPSGGRAITFIKWDLE